MLFLTALRLHWPQPCNPSEPSEISTEVAWAKPGSISYRSMPAMLPNINPNQALGSPQGCLNVPNDSDWKHKLALGTRFAFGLFQSLTALSKFMSRKPCGLCGLDVDSNRRVYVAKKNLSNRDQRCHQPPR